MINTNDSIILYGTSPRGIDRHLHLTLTPSGTIWVKMVDLSQDNRVEVKQVGSMEVNSWTFFSNIEKLIEIRRERVRSAK